MPMVASDNAHVIKRDVEHQLQVDAAQNPDDKNNYKLDDLPDEGMGRRNWSVFVLEGGGAGWRDT